MFFDTCCGGACLDSSERLARWFHPASFGSSALIGIGVIAIQKTEAAAMSLLDDIVGDGPVLSPELARPKCVS